MTVITLSGSLVRTPRAIPLPGSDFVLDAEDVLGGAFTDGLTPGRGGPGLIAPLDVFVEMALIGSEKVGTASGVAQTDDRGAFAFELDFGDVVGLAPVAAFRASADVYLPYDRQDAFSVSSFLVANQIDEPGTPDERIFAVAQRAVADVRVPVNTRGMRRSDIGLVPMPNEAPSEPFADMPDITIELLAVDDRRVLGVAPAPGDANERTVDMVHVTDMPEHYLTVRRGTLRGSLADDTRTLARSRPQPARTGRVRPQRVVMIRITQEVGIGTMADNIPEEAAIAGTPVVVRNVDLDFVTHGDRPQRVLRVRASIGIGWEEDDGGVFYLWPLGAFEGRYALDTRRLARPPFADAEIDTMLEITNLTAVYDLFPGTDVDELIPGGTAALELAIARFIDDELKPRLRDTFARRTRQAIEDRRRAVQDDSPAGLEEGWAELVGLIFDTFFVQPEPLVVTADDLVLTARVGFWSNELDTFTGDLDCPANALAFIAPRSRVRPAARSVERHLRQEELSGWRELFDEHRKELRSLLVSDPETARELAELLVRKGVPDGSAAALTSAEIDRVRSIAERWIPRLSDELQARLPALDERLADLEGASPTQFVSRLLGGGPPRPRG